MQIWMQLMQWIHHMTPWVAVGMAALESLFPPIPLTAVVAANVAAFGAVFGFLYSWIGSAVGSALVFFAVRAVAGLPAVQGFLGRDKIEKARKLIGGLKPLALFFIIMLPFTPSSFVNFACGVSHYRGRRYLAVMLPAKAVMVASLSLLGESLQQAANPFRIAAALLLLVLLYLVSKWATKHHHLEDEKNLKKDEKSFGKSLTP